MEILGPSDFSFNASYDDELQLTNVVFAPVRTVASMNDASQDLADYLFTEEFIYEADPFVYESELSLKLTVEKLVELGFHRE